MAAGEARSPPLDLGDRMRAAEALQGHLAFVAEPEASIRDGRLEVTGDEDLFTRGEICDPEGVDHRLAEELVLVADRLAAVETDADVDRLLGRDWPQSPQNLAVSRFSRPQLAQFATDRF